MSGKWTAEEVRELLLKIAGGPISVTQRVELFDIASNYAERIKADEGVVPSLVYLGCNNGAPEFRWNCRWNELEAGTSFYTNPPAQAAQVDEHGKCFVDGLGWVVLCSRAAEYARLLTTTAEPVAQREADELIDAYDDAVRRERESGFLPPLAQQAARDCVSHNRSRLRKALAAQPRAVLDGWALVPVHPTHAMCEAAHTGPNCGETALDASCRAFWEDCYAAMLAAAPSPGESE